MGGDVGFGVGGGVGGEVGGGAVVLPAVFLGGVECSESSHVWQLTWQFTVM